MAGLRAHSHSKEFIRAPYGEKQEGNPVEGKWDPLAGRVSGHESAARVKGLGGVTQQNISI